MTSVEKQKIIQLIIEFSKLPGTESLITYVASIDGMISSVTTLLSEVENDNSVETYWLQGECIKHKVVFHDFLSEISHINSLFQEKGNTNKNLEILGLAEGADQEEIKQAYRKLSIKYHPDTATGQDKQKSNERFIEINSAYQALINSTTSETVNLHSPHQSHWGPDIYKQSPTFPLKKIIISLSIVAVFFIFLAVIGAINVRNRAMLAGLQEADVAFVPPQITEKRITQSTKILTEVSKSPERKTRQSQIESLKKSTSKPISNKLDTVQTKPPDQNKESLFDRVEPVQPGEQAVHQIVKNEKSASLYPITNQQLESENIIANPGGSKNADIEQPKNIVKVTGPQSSSIVKAVQQEKLTTEINKKQITIKEIEHTKTAATPVKPVNELEKKKEESNNTPQPELIEKLLPLEERIESFFKAYVQAYEKKNIVSFSRFFHENATENGKIFSESIPAYLELFDETEVVNLHIDIISLEESQKIINVEGRFSIEITYKNSREVTGKGFIAFILKASDNTFLIKDLIYKFD